MEKILLIGYPGAGKGTQAKLLKPFELYQISTGDVIRASKDPRIINYRKEQYNKGILLSDELIFEILKQEIASLPTFTTGYLLDGAVRTLPQAEYVRKHSLIEKVLYFELSKETAIKRLLERDEGRRDDSPEAIEGRFEEFNKKTAPIITYLEQNFEFHMIDSEPSIEKIHLKVLSALNLYNKDFLN